MFDKQKTMLGIEEHVKTMLATDGWKFMQNDHLDENFHVTKQKFEDRHGSLIQPTQEELFVKRVQLDLLKGTFSDNEKNETVCYDTQA